MRWDELFLAVIVILAIYLMFTGRDHCDHDEVKRDDQDQD